VGQDFNCVLCNLYRDGRDSMGWHADNERELGPAPVIASISLGAERQFQLKSRTDSTQRHALLLEHGSLLVMAGDLQQHWLHQLPKTARVDRPRINLTFRCIAQASG
jgi:alkylated DNA repair dioxygenase AlkB